MSTTSDRARNVRNPITLWRWLRGLTLVYLALKLCGAAVFALSHGFTIAGVDSNIIDWGDSLYVFASPLVYLACLVVTYLLTYRLMKNLHEWSPGQVDTSPAWAVAYYVIPFVNLYMPPRIVGEIWRASFWQEDEPRQAKGIIALWWTTVLITLVTTIVASSGVTESDVFMVQFNLNLNPSKMTPLAGVSSALAGLAALFFLNVVGRAAHEQSRLITKRAAPAKADSVAT